MKVYHGSYIEINTINLSKGELQRDFGQGFYVTKLREQAEYWATRKGRYKKNNDLLLNLPVTNMTLVSILCENKKNKTDILPKSQILV